LIKVNDTGLVILAGGEGRRMGGQNKGLLELMGQPLISHVLQRLDPGVSQRVISANNNITAYQQLGYPVIEDRLPGQLGPLAGIYSALESLHTEWLLTVPCDLPLLPTDYVQRMLDHDGKARAYVAFDGERQQSGCCLLHHSLQSDLLTRLQHRQLAVHRFLAEHQAEPIDFSDESEGFININTPEQFAQLKQKIEQPHA
jgi:molybdopterin-guanine dinucleotide biosynthesis protein A